MTKIMVTQYQIENLDWDAFQKKARDVVKKAKEANVDLLVLPEYAGIEISDTNFENDFEHFSSLQSHLPNYLEFFQELANKNNLYIQAGTIPVAVGEQFFNRAYFFSPNGKYGFQDKLQLTSYENNSQVITRGHDQTLFETSLGKIAIAVCYDAEFPEIVRKLVNAGASLILVPSYTTTVAGYYRVSISARARAIENQCYVAVSMAVVSAEGGGLSEKVYGRAGIYGPSDLDYPLAGVIAEGEMDAIQLVTGEISQGSLEYVRAHGEVHNFDDLKFCRKIHENPSKTLNL